MKLSKEEKQKQRAVNELVSTRFNENVKPYLDYDSPLKWNMVIDNMYMSYFTGKIYLKSYDTIIAYYDTNNFSLYEFLRLRYHWTKQSQKHIYSFLAIIRAIYGNYEYYGYLKV